MLLGGLVDYFWVSGYNFCPSVFGIPAQHRADQGKPFTLAPKPQIVEVADPAQEGILLPLEQNPIPLPARLASAQPEQSLLSQNRFPVLQNHRKHTLDLLRQIQRWIAYPPPLLRKRQNPQTSTHSWRITST